MRETPAGDEGDILVTGEWGDARPADVRAVCRSVAACFGRAIAERPVERIQVEPGADCPHAFFMRTTEGRVRIRLTARDRYWAQFAYQFAHEFGHLLTNFTERTVPSATVVDEVLAEAASRYALPALAARWATDPPYPNWREYAPAFESYAAGVTAATLAVVDVPTHALAAWLERDMATWKSGTCPRARDVEGVLACRLMPLTARPEFWPAARYLNLGAHVPFGPEYFIAWRGAAPDRLHKPINGLEQLLLS